MGPYRISRFLAGFFVIASIVLLIVFRKRRSIFGEEGLRLQNEAIAAAKAKKAEEKAAKVSAGKLVDDDAFTETDALADAEESDEEKTEDETAEPSAPEEPSAEEVDSTEKKSE